MTAKELLNTLNEIITPDNENAEVWFERNYKACAQLRRTLGIEEPGGVG